MARVPHRAVPDDEDLTFTDWRTLDLSVTTVRPQEAALVEANKSVSLGEGITLTNKSGLIAAASLMTDPEASRDLGSLALPNWLREDPPVHSQPFVLTSTRSAGQPGLSVLALNNVQNYQSVTPETPLKLHVPVPLAAHEQVLPIGFDGEFFLPLGRVTGRADGTEITLERLPAPEPTKSLANSIRIYFQKVVSQVSGGTFDYPLLAMASYGQGKLAYEHDLERIKARVAESSRIVVYIHGIIGKTESMAASAWLGTLKETAGLAALAGRYDLVLTFDYENLNTGIKETAVSLRDRLAAVGLGSGHDKTVHLVAHSMGGLVSRWLIEHVQGGKEMVQHLFMLGTPNGGSPWPKIQDWAVIALSLGLNSLAPVAWPVTVIGGLLNLIEKIDVMLDEMAVDSPFLKALAEGPDPGVPYTIIAGNTSIIEAARLENGSGDSPVQRLLNRLSSQNIMHSTANLAFFSQPNDVAVSVDSIKNVPLARSPQPQILEIACDHMSYFTTEVGLRTLAEAVTMTPAGKK
jgi:hypothetical protein